MLVEIVSNIILSVLAGLIVSFTTHEYWALPVAFAGGVLIDADHVLDYLLFTKGRSMSLREFISGVYFERSGKIYVVLHGYEYAAAFLALGAIHRSWSWLFWALGLSMMFHMIFDVLSYKPKWLTYSIVYRLSHGFNLDSFGFRKCAKTT
jgi:hypothetical protein